MLVDLIEVEAKLLEKKFDPKKVAEVIRELEAVVEELKEEKQAEKEAELGVDIDGNLLKPKWEYVIILNDKEGYLKDKEIAGWVLQKPEDDDANLILGKLQEAAINQNESAKRKKNTITDFVELFESIKPKWLKEKKLRIKTKELTRVITTNGNFLQ